MIDYADFCRDKLDYSYVAGFPCELDEIHASLMPHQRAIVRWAVEGGRRAIFAAFGLGKTRMALEAVRLTLAKSGGRRALIIKVKLGVGGQVTDRLRIAQALNLQIDPAELGSQIVGRGVSCCGCVTTGA